MPVLHLDTAKNWRGGQNQVYLMTQGLKAQDITSYFAVPQGAYSVDKFGEVGEVFTYKTWGLPHFFQARKIAAFAKEKKITLIDAHSSHAHSLALAIKKWYPEVHIVVHRRVDNKPRMNFFSRRKYLSRNISQFIAISHAIKKVLVGVGVEEEKISVACSAVRETQIRPEEKQRARELLRKRLNLSPETVVLSCAAAFTLQKGQWVLLEALKILTERMDLPNWHCVFAGDGELLDEMKRFSHALALDNKVTFLGFINKVPELLMASDVFVLPSINEGLGTIILDAIFAGNAVVASEVGGIPEMIKNDETGLLAPVEDERSLAHQLSLVILDSELRSRLASQARSHACSAFSLEAMVAGNLAIYRKIDPSL